MRGTPLPSSLTHAPPGGSVHVVRVHVGFCIWVLHSGADCLVKETASA